MYYLEVWKCTWDTNDARSYYRETWLLEYTYQKPVREMVQVGACCLVCVAVARCDLQHCQPFNVWHLILPSIRMFFNKGEITRLFRYVSRLNRENDLVFAQVGNLGWVCKTEEKEYGKNSAIDLNTVWHNSDWNKITKAVWYGNSLFLDLRVFLSNLASKHYYGRCDLAV